MLVDVDPIYNLCLRGLSIVRHDSDRSVLWLKCAYRLLPRDRSVLIDSYAFIRKSVVLCAATWTAALGVEYKLCPSSHPLSMTFHSSFLIAHFLQSTSSRPIVSRRQAVSATEFVGFIFYF